MLGKSDLIFLVFVLPGHDGKNEMNVHPQLELNTC